VVVVVVAAAADATGFFLLGDLDFFSLEQPSILHHSLVQSLLNIMDIALDLKYTYIYILARPKKKQ